MFNMHRSRDNKVAVKVYAKGLFSDLAQDIHQYNLEKYRVADATRYE